MLFDGSLPTFQRTLVFSSSLVQKTKKNSDALLVPLPFDDEDPTARESSYLERVYIGSGADTVCCRKKECLLVIRE